MSIASMPLNRTAFLTPNSRTVFYAIRRNSLITLAGAAAVVIYLCYIFVSFDVGGLISRAQPNRAVLLATDAVAHKVHVTQNLRGTSSLTVAVEGERTATYDTPPDGWSSRKILYRWTWEKG
jgi:phosphonate transport system permease protein